MMRAYRITSRLYASDPLSGVGAATYGARWNGKGVRVGYAASSRALAMIELMVHLASPRHPPRDRVLVPVEIPDDAIADLVEWPQGWNALPCRLEVQAVGNAWIRASSSLALRVPSALVHEEFNVLVNPAHPRFREITVLAAEAIAWDERLFR